MHWHKTKSNFIQTNQNFYLTTCPKLESIKKKKHNNKINQLSAYLFLGPQSKFYIICSNFQLKFFFIYYFFLCVHIIIQLKSFKISCSLVIFSLCGWVIPSLCTLQCFLNEISFEKEKILLNSVMYVTRY
jgi:hypothetical protein